MLHEQRTGLRWKPVTRGQDGAQGLREYYAKEDKSHEAADGASSSIAGLLEVAESDFATGLSEMIAQEDVAAA